MKAKTPELGEVVKLKGGGDANFEVVKIINSKRVKIHCWFQGFLTVKTNELEGY